MNNKILNQPQMKISSMTLPNHYIWMYKLVKVETRTGTKGPLISMSKIFGVYTYKRQKQ